MNFKRSLNLTRKRFEILVFCVFPALITILLTIGYLGCSDCPGKETLTISSFGVLHAVESHYGIVKIKGTAASGDWVDLQFPCGGYRVFRPSQGDVDFIDNAGIIEMNVYNFEEIGVPLRESSTEARSVLIGEEGTYRFSISVDAAFVQHWEVDKVD